MGFGVGVRGWGRGGVGCVGVWVLVRGRPLCLDWPRKAAAFLPRESAHTPPASTGERAPCSFVTGEMCRRRDPGRGTSSYTYSTSSASTSTYSLLLLNLHLPSYSSSYSSSFTSYGASRGARVCGRGCSVLAWARRLIGSGADGPMSYEQLDAEAALVPPGSEGLLCVESFQGSRTPVTDAWARGGLVGLSLAHTRAHLWRAMLEACCLGTRAALQALGNSGIYSQQLAIAGGATRSALWLQMHADCTGLTVLTGECDNAPLIGSAVLAAVGAGLFCPPQPTGPSHQQQASTEAYAAPAADCTTSGEVAGARGEVAGSQKPPFGSGEELREQVVRAVGHMVRSKERLEPNAGLRGHYDRLFHLYTQASSAFRPLSQQLSRRPPSAQAFRTYSCETSVAPTSLSPEAPIGGQRELQAGHADGVLRVVGLGGDLQVAPSMLSADFGSLAEEAAACEAAGARWLHIDVCDGGKLCSHQLTLGPAAVAAIRRRCPTLQLDIHVVGAQGGAELVEAMAAAGATRFIFQMEALDTRDDAISLARRIRKAGMAAGVCIAPGVPPPAPTSRSTHRQLLADVRVVPSPPTMPSTPSALLSLG